MTTTSYVLSPLEVSPGPRRAAACVTGREAGYKGHAAELDFIAVFENSVDLAGLPAVDRIEILAFAARGNDAVVAAHHVDLGSRLLLQEGVAGDVVGVGVAGQQDLDVGHLVEAERLHGFGDQGDGALEAAVDQDVPIGRGDQVAGQILRADIVDVVDDAMRGKGLKPVDLADGGDRHGESKGCDSAHE